MSLQTMLTVVEKFSLLVVDSRLIADELGLNHASWMTNVVKKYQLTLEANFFSLHFENEVRKREIGATTEKFTWLTEDQATFLMTLSRNTEQVVQAKINLVKAFADAKKRLVPSSQPLTQIQALAVMIQQMAEQEQQLLQQEARIVAIEVEQERYQTPCGHKYTVMGFANLNGLKISLECASEKGKKASALCRKQGIKVERVHDPRFGKVGLYPQDVLAEVFQ